MGTREPKPVPVGPSTRKEDVRRRNHAIAGNRRLGRIGPQQPESRSTSQRSGNSRHQPRTSPQGPRLDPVGERDLKNPILPFGFPGHSAIQKDDHRETAVHPGPKRHPIRLVAQDRGSESSGLEFDLQTQSPRRVGLLHHPISGWSPILESQLDPHRIPFPFDRHSIQFTGRGHAFPYPSEEDQQEYHAPDHRDAFFSRLTRYIS